MIRCQIFIIYFEAKGFATLVSIFKFLLSLSPDESLVQLKKRAKKLPIEELGLWQASQLILLAFYSTYGLAKYRT